MIQAAGLNLHHDLASAGDGLGNIAQFEFAGFAVRCELRRFHEAIQHLKRNEDKRRRCGDGHKTCLFCGMKIVVMVACLFAALVSNAQDAETNAFTYKPGDVIPLFVMDDVPLRDAVRIIFVREEMGSYIFDARVINSFVGPLGPSEKEPKVSGRWEK